MTTRRLGLRLESALLLMALLLAAAPGAAGACGRDTDCRIGDRSYRIVLPAGHDGNAAIGAIVFAHGYRGTAAGVMRNKALTALASELGVAFIAAQAAGDDWKLPGAPGADGADGTAELAYFDALIEDAARRFAVDRTRLMATGFSAGGMMVWTLACHRGAAFAGFAPIAGTFWAPVPRACPSTSVNLIHTHGTEDPVVPLGGRKIGNAHQGDVFEAMELFKQSGGYRPAETETDPGLRCERQVNPDGRLLELCLFKGKHELRVGHLRRAWREFGLADGG